MTSRTSNRRKRRRWGVVYPAEKSYASGRKGGVAWTHNLRTARLVAGSGGVVVDADWLKINWPVVARGEPIPEEALAPAGNATLAGTKGA